MGLTENIRIIRAHPTFGTTFECLEAPLRHGNAHASYEISDGKVLIWDDRKTPAKVVADYTFGEVTNAVRSAEQFLFPVALNQWLMTESAIKALILVNPEHKFYLLGVGNS